jgi:hypothetical protein
MTHHYDPQADAAAIDLVAALPSAIVDAIVFECIASMKADGLPILPYQLMHDICDPNQYLADATDNYFNDHDNGYVCIAMANRCTDRYDETLGL